jgi:hypothetical protein
MRILSQYYSFSILDNILPISRLCKKYITKSKPKAFYFCYPSKICGMSVQKTLERRLRVRRKDIVKTGKAHINPVTMRDLKITSRVEIVLVGKRRFTFDSVEDATVPPNEVWINSDDAKANGIADNSIATVRAERS